MLKIDHLVLNIDEKYQNSNNCIESIRSTGILYEPTWGKKTNGFKVSNIWLGKEYFELTNVIEEDGGGWMPSWTNLYNEGHRGLICLMLDTNNIDDIYETIKSKDINISEPEFLKFKWGFNLFTRTMPWRNSYVPFFEGVPFQIGFQQMKDEKSLDFMQQYMVPNSTDNGILGITKIIIQGNFTTYDFSLINKIFDNTTSNDNNIIVSLDKQSIVFEKAPSTKVIVYTSCINSEYTNKETTIENVTIKI